MIVFVMLKSGRKSYSQKRKPESHFHNGFYIILTSVINLALHRVLYRFHDGVVSPVAAI